MGGKRLSFMGWKIWSYLTSWSGAQVRTQIDTADVVLGCLVSMIQAIVDGKSPAIQISDRAWNDESSGASITMPAPEVRFGSFRFCHHLLILETFHWSDLLYSHTF